MKRIKIGFLVKPVFFIVALLAGIYLVLYIEKLRPSDFGFYKDIFSKEIVIERSKSYPIRPIAGKLTGEDMEYACIAWQYFENNTNDSTGLANSVHLYPSATLWDEASYAHAICSAYEIGIIDSAEFDKRLTMLFATLQTMPLYKGEYPNKVYNTATVTFTDYANNPVEEGVGWSAMDIGRFFSVVNRIKLHYPAYTTMVKKAVQRWSVDDIIIDGTLHSISFSTKDRTPQVVQEGKLGYEEYCAKGLMMVGFDVYEALRYDDFIKFEEIYGVDIAVDTREVKYFPSYNYVLSEPYILDGLEYGWDVNSKELAYRVFKAQKLRYNRKGIVTAVSEDHVDQEPYFIYNTVYADGEEWNCVSESGDPVPDLKQLSTKAAFGWWTLYNDPYTEILKESMDSLYNGYVGWYAGRYEESGEINRTVTANTNAVILECLNYKLRGPLVKLKP